MRIVDKVMKLVYIQNMFLYSICILFDSNTFHYGNTFSASHAFRITIIT